MQKLNMSLDCLVGLKVLMFFSIYLLLYVRFRPSFKSIIYFSQFIRDQISPSCDLEWFFIFIIVSKYDFEMEVQAH